MDLEIRHLRLMQALDEEGTQTRAARRLFLTQSALSHQLSELERRIGTPLFHRIGRKRTLTQAGRRLLKASHAILPQVSNVVQDLRGLAEGRLGRIRLTTQCYSCYNWIPRVLPAFRNLHPSVDVEIVPDASGHVMSSLLEGEIDVALAYDFDVEDWARITPIWEDELVAVVPRRHPFASRPHLEAHDFANENLLIHSDRLEDTLFYSRVLDPAGVRPKRISPLRLTEAIASMVAAGAGIAVMTPWSIARELEAGEVVAVPVTEMGLRRSWHAVRMETEEENPPREDLIDLLQGGPVHLFEGGETPQADLGFAIPS